MEICNNGDVVTYLDPNDGKLEKTRIRAIAHQFTVGMKSEKQRNRPPRSQTSQYSAI